MKHFAMRPLVYLAGPYTKPDPLANTRRAVAVADELHASGHVTVVVPHVTLLWDLISPQEPDHWYAYDFTLLARCDALLRMPGESIGSDREVAFAQSRGIVVFHDQETLLDWAERQTIKPRRGPFLGW